MMECALLYSYIPKKHTIEHRLTTEAARIRDHHKALDLAVPDWVLMENIPPSEDLSWDCNWWNAWHHGQFEGSLD